MTASLRVRCENAPWGGKGENGKGEDIVVEPVEDGVELDVNDVTEAAHRRRITLTSDEARALAAALLHFADQWDRR